MVDPVVIDSEDDLLRAVEDISSYRRVVLDTEGVNLGRTGELTVLTLHAFDSTEETPIYVVDVKTMGGSRVFSKTLPSFRDTLEDSSIEKVTFDCRTDSDALFHQFGVTLSGVVDMQIFDQAVRIHQGEAPPKRNVYLKKKSVPMLSSMDKVSSRYSIRSSLFVKTAPHKQFGMKSPWSERPLSSDCINYAAKDVEVIKLLWVEMSGAGISSFLKERVALHSKRYEGMFRDHHLDVRSTQGFKDFIVEERAIATEDELPYNHPLKPTEQGSYSDQKWNQTVALLRSNGSETQKAFSGVLYILQHNEWYTKEGRDEIRRLSANYPFSFNQKKRIGNPPDLVDRYEDECYYCDDY